jgi:hypothetical protein
MASWRKEPVPQGGLGMDGRLVGSRLGLVLVLVLDGNQV